MLTNNNNRYKFSNKSILATLITLNVTYGMVLTSLSLASPFLSAEQCQGSDDKKWECASKDVQVSPTVLEFKGNEPEAGIGLEIIRKNTDGSIIDLPKSVFLQDELTNELILNPGFQLYENDILKLNFFLKNGLDKATLAKFGIENLEGAFDKDGDPINQPAMFDSIKWKIANLNEKSDEIVTSESKDEFILTHQFCNQNGALTVEITPYTFTGSPNKGQMVTYTIKGADNSSIFNHCIPYLKDEDIKLVITRQAADENSKAAETETILDERIQDNAFIEAIPKSGDIYTASFYQKLNGSFIDISEKIRPSVIWGYLVYQGDNLFIEGDKKQNTNLVYWMDGTQEMPNFRSKSLLFDTTGQLSFTVQKNNSDARVSNPIHKSEQSMRIVIKFGLPNTVTNE